MKFRCQKESKGGWRSWWYPFGYDKNRFCVHNEFYPFTDSKMPGIKLELEADCERTISFSIRIPFLFSWWFSIDAMWGYSDWWRNFLRLDDERKYDGRQWGISWYNGDGCMSGGSLDLYLGSHTNMWKSSDPKWYRFSIYPQEVLFGKWKAESKDGEITKHKISVSESKNFPASEHEVECKEFITTWTWPRFRKPFILTRYEVSCKEGVPHPGKGTAAYNCEDTCLYSSTTPSKSREEAVDKFKESAEYYRKHYPL